MSSQSGFLHTVFFTIIIFSIMRKRRSAIRVRLGVDGHLSTTHTWGNPVCLSAFTNDTTSELVGFLHTVPLMLTVKQVSCEYTPILKS